MTTTEAAAQKPLTLAEAERDAAQLRAAIAEEHKRHATTIANLQANLTTSLELAQRLASGLDENLIAQAKHLIDVDGLYSRAGDDREQARAYAIDSILAGGQSLAQEYVGTKNYAHWYGQMVRHPYGMGPRHGSVVFAIGLRQSVRARAPRNTPVSALPPLLIEDEINAIVYYLRNLEKIEAAHAAAAPA